MKSWRLCGELDLALWLTGENSSFYLFVPFRKEFWAKGLSKGEKGNWVPFGADKTFFSADWVETRRKEVRLRLLTYWLWMKKKGENWFFPEFILRSRVAALKKAKLSSNPPSPFSPIRTRKIRNSYKSTTTRAWQWHQKPRNLSPAHTHASFGRRLLARRG